MNRLDGMEVWIGIDNIPTFTNALNTRCGVISTVGGGETVTVNCSANTVVRNDIKLPAFLVYCWIILSIWVYYSFKCFFVFCQFLNDFVVVRLFAGHFVCRCFCFCVWACQFISVFFV